MDSTHVLAAIRVLSRLELVAETLRAALNDLATAKLATTSWVIGVFGDIRRRRTS
jgi:hypothetical protein